MRRRTALEWLAGILGGFFDARPQTAAIPTTFSDTERAALRRVAAAVLPSSLSSVGCERVAEKFEQYVGAYRAGAETEHGYGITHVRTKPASPLITYKSQLQALPAVISKGDVERVLNGAGVKELPRIPEGKHVITDLMSFYFRSSEANDLCYRAEIGRDECRGLAGSERAPRPLRGLA